jgi:hypothetical protein
MLRIGGYLGAVLPGNRIGANFLVLDIRPA